MIITQISMPARVVCGACVLIWSSWSVFGKEEEGAGRSGKEREGRERAQNDASATPIKSKKAHVGIDMSAQIRIAFRACTRVRTRMAQCDAIGNDYSNRCNAAQAVAGSRKEETRHSSASASTVH